MAPLEPLIHVSHLFLLHVELQSQDPMEGTATAALLCLVWGSCCRTAEGSCVPPAAAFCTAESAVFLFLTLLSQPNLGTHPYQSELGWDSRDLNPRERDL